MKKPKTIKPGTVKKIIKPPFAAAPEKAEIVIQDADELYREIRIENDLKDGAGKRVKLKEGAEVEVTVEADAEDTFPEQ
jgi:predicted DNA-binding antitoxin AbrB/MazE fold protein